MFHVIFHCQNEWIEKITLHEGKGWQIIGDTHLKPLIDSWMEAYLLKKPIALPLPLKLNSLTPFTRKVLEIISKIPFGQTISYKQLAIELGQPTAFRAAGGACGRNPFPLVIPCHRVCRSSNQGLGGFAFGLTLKSILLKFEEIGI